MIRGALVAVLAVFSGSYAGVVPPDLTGCDWRAVEAFDDGTDGGSPLRVVPQKVGATLMRLMQSEYDVR